jgi:DNA-directed RNA polymerase specialized sigma24 family protein
MRTDFDKVTKKAYQIAYAILQNHEDAEEVSQDVAIIFFENHKTLQRIRYAVIDVIRAKFGRTRLPCGSHRPSKRSLTISLDEEAFEQGSRSLRHELIGGAMVDTEPERLDLPHEITATSSRTEIMLWAYRSGLNQRQIADALGKSESRVSQILSPLLLNERLEEKLKQKLRFAEKAERCASEFAVNWWVL